MNQMQNEYYTFQYRLSKYSASKQIPNHRFVMSRVTKGTPNRLQVLFFATLSATDYSSIFTDSLIESCLSLFIYLCTKQHTGITTKTIEVCCLFSPVRSMKDMAKTILSNLSLGNRRPAPLTNPTQIPAITAYCHRHRQKDPLPLSLSAIPI